MADQPLLRGHKRLGKRFIPPLNQLPSVNYDTGYVNDMLPELVWLGLINDRLGLIPGSRFFEDIVAATTEAVGKGPKRNYALMSELGSLNAEERETFLGILSRSGMLEPLRDYVAPLILLYNECPIDFIGAPNKVFHETDLIKSIKNCVGRHIDKYETPGIILHGMMLLARLVAGTIRFPADLKIPDINSVIEAPESEDAQLAAGFLRANALGEFGALQIDKSWARRFWNRNFEISECEFNYKDNA